MLWILRFALLILIFSLLYSLFKYLTHPKRKLEQAQEQKRFYLLDDPINERKNFWVTFKGILFEGEKYSGPINGKLEVVSIFIRPHHSALITGISKNDILEIESKLATLYPHAKIDWKSPIQELLH